MNRLRLGVGVLGLAGLVVVLIVVADRFGPAPDAVERGAPAIASGDPAAPGEHTADSPPAVDEPAATRTQAGALPSSPGSVSGAVLQIRVLHHPERTPVVGARVAVVDSDLLTRHIAALPAPTTLAVRRRARDALAVVVVTDASGMARLAPPGRRHSITVTAGTLYGRRFLHELPDGPVEILIAEDRSLRVRVLSESTRQPVAGVWVAMEGEGAGGRQRTDAEGLVAFQHAQVQLIERSGWTVGVAAPLRQRVAMPVALASLSAEPIVLLLPSTGGLLVRVCGKAGTPVSGTEVRLSLEAFHDSQRLADTAMRYADLSGVGADGLARCRHLDLGLFLRVTAYPRDQDSLHRPVVVDVDGPRQPGESVSCEVIWGGADDLEAHFPVVTGRFVRRNRTPWGAVALSCRPQLFPYTGHIPSQTLQVAGDGRFRLALRVPCPAGGRRIYRMRTEPASTAAPAAPAAPNAPAAPAAPAAPIECHLDLSRTFPPGATDLGDIVLDRGQLLAAGQVVDDAGQPLSHADIRVCQLALGKRRDYWPEIDCSGGHTLSASGGFAVYAIPGQPLPSRRLRLRVHSRGLLTNQGVDFQLGATGLRVVLQRGGALAGSVALAAGQVPDDIRVTLVQGERRFGLRLLPDGSFGRTGLNPGQVRLVACFATGDAKLEQASRRELDGLEILPGETNRDPRIQGLVFAGRVPRVELTVVDAFGAPVQRAQGWWPGHPRGMGGSSDDRGRLTIRPAALPVDVEVAAFGYRKVQLRDLRQPQRVVLARGLPARLVTDAKVIGRDPAYHLGFFLYHVDAKGRRADLVYGSFHRYDKLYFDANGEARLSLPRPGTYELTPRIYLSGKDGVGTGGPVQQPEVQRFTVLERDGEQTFRPRIPAAAVAEAVWRYAR